MRNAAWLATLCLGVACADATAEDFSWHSMGSDAGEYATAPLRWDLEDWTGFGVTLAALAGSHELDSRVAHHFAAGNTDSKDQNSLRDAAPVAAMMAGTLAASVWLRDRDGFNETFSMGEAAVFSLVTAEVGKYAAGRLRPDQSASPDRWRSGGSSFPSLHATAAFAVGTVLAESGNDDYRWIRRIIGYSIGVGTAYIRVKENQHWMSDTVAGSAIGLSTARFVLNRHGNASSGGTVAAAPVPGGVQITYQYRF